MTFIEAIALQDIGHGRPYLLLHGGGGPRTVAGFAELLAGSGPARVLLPTHPGFAGTPRPPEIDSVKALAHLYLALLEHLDLTGVTVIGNSIGGWIATEMALANNGRVGEIVLANAAGFVVEGKAIADVNTLSPAELRAHSFHDPSRFPASPDKPSPDLPALLVYGGKTMNDPTLLARAKHVTVAVRVLWGESDRIVTPAYGRAIATAIPGATFTLIPASGHLPLLETPEQALAAIRP